MASIDFSLEQRRHLIVLLNREIGGYQEYLLRNIQFVSNKDSISYVMSNMLTECIDMRNKLESSVIEEI